MNREIHIKITLNGKSTILVSAVLFSFTYILIIVTKYPLYLLTLFLGMVSLSIIILSWFLTRIRLIALESLEIERVLPEKIYEGEEVEVEVKLINNRSFGIYLARLVDEYPTSTRLVSGASDFLGVIPARSKVSFTYKLKVDAIGKHKFRGLYLYTQDFLGIFEITALYKEINKNSIKCMPKPSLAELAYEGESYLLGSFAPTKIGGYGFEFKDIREYHSGDELRRIDWKASARTGKLMIIEYEKEAISDIVIVLDLSKWMFIGKLGMRKIDFSARTIAYVINAAMKHGDRVGLLLIGDKEYKVIPIRKASLNTYLQITDLISEIPVEYEGYRTEENVLDLKIDNIISGLNIREKTLFIVISDLEEEYRSSYISDLIFFLRGIGHSVVLISPYTPLFELELLSGELAAIYRVETYKGLKSRVNVKNKFIQYGIPIIDVGPDDMIPAILKRLERFKRLTPT